MMRRLLRLLVLWVCLVPTEAFRSGDQQRTSWSNVDWLSGPSEARKSSVKALQAYLLARARSPRTLTAFRLASRHPLMVSTAVGVREQRSLQTKSGPQWESSGARVDQNLVQNLVQARSDERARAVIRKTIGGSTSASDLQGSSYNPLATHLQQIGKYRQLTPEEVHELSSVFQKAQAWKEKLLEIEERLGHSIDDEDVPAQLGVKKASEYSFDLKRGEMAKKILVNHNLQLVVWVAKKYRHVGLDFLELIQEGTFGLIKAVEKFDSSKGFRFSTYATWWIRQSMQRAASEKSRTVRLPPHMHDLVGRLRKVKRDLENAGTSSSHEKIAEAMQTTVEKVKRIETALQVSQSVSMESPIGNSKKGGEKTSTLESKLRSDDESPLEYVEQLDLKEKFNCMLDTILNDREAMVLRMRHGLTGYDEPCSLQIVGDELNVSRERVRQIETKALLKLRTSSCVQRLMESDVSIPAPRPFGGFDRASACHNLKHRRSFAAYI